MPEQDPIVLSYSHLKALPREKDALQTLKRIASVVKPIMRARGWVVRELAEFYPDQHNLLGLNVNRGQKILLRLRYAGDRNQFLPVEQVTDTMLHELSHIVHGPHDAKFHALWNQLRDEHESLVMKGYTGEGFLSDGHRLGGRRLPMHEARRLARAAAEKRRTLSAGSGQKLGGAGLRPGDDIRRVIVDAVEGRNRSLQGCGNANHDEREIREISDRATRNGFRTQAEEDAANDAAIAQALWELVQEDEQAKYGRSYIPPSAANPEGNGGGTVLADQPSAKSPTNGKEPRASRSPASPSKAVSPPDSHSRTLETTPRSRSPLPGWACGICTLHNPADFLCCDGCGSERSEDDKKRLANGVNKRPRVAAATQVSAAAPAPTWRCSFCETEMERQWWTCVNCGTVKASSK